MTNPYDQVGNLISKRENGTPITYTYGVTQPHAVRNLTNGWAYTYNLNGNMTKRVENGVTYTQTWDVENRLVVVTSTVSAAKPVSRFTYDGDGARVLQVQISGTQVITTVYAGALEVTISGTQRITKTYYSAGSQLIALRQFASPTSSVLYFLHSDHLGSTSLTTDASGNPVARQLYDAWGNVRYVTGTLPTDIGYTGQRLDTYIKLLFLRARYYSPENGGFLSKDMWQGDYTKPQSLNGWTYVEGNPINFDDPTGWCRGEPGNGIPGLDECIKKAKKLSERYEILIDPGPGNLCDEEPLIGPGLGGIAISWKSNELRVIEEALELTRSFLDHTNRPFVGYIGGDGYTIRRVHITSQNADMLVTSRSPVLTEVPNGLFDGVHPGPDQQASLVHEFFHAFDYFTWGHVIYPFPVGGYYTVSDNYAFAQNRPVYVGDNPYDPKYRLDPDEGSIACGSTAYACSNQYENFADNTAVYALDWLAQKQHSLLAEDALKSFPNADYNQVRRVAQWTDYDGFGHSMRRVFLNRYFFGNEADGLGGH